MGILGIDSFKSKRQRESELANYNNSIFPYGNKQKEIIIDYLKKLFPNEKQEEILYDFIVLKQKILDKENINDLTNVNVICKKVNIPLLIELIKIDINIDNNLNYPNVEKIIEIGKLKIE